jgi:hypothetical protein
VADDRASGSANALIPSSMRGRSVTPLCQAGTDYPHRSTTVRFQGNLSVHSWTHCNILLSHTVVARLYREKCYFWVFCGWPKIAEGSYSNPSALQARATAARACEWRVGWYMGRGVHTTVHPTKTVTVPTRTDKAVRLWCW